MKTCRICKESLEIINFSKAAGNRDGYRNECKNCSAALYRAKKEKDPEGLRLQWKRASKKYHTTERRRNKTLRQYGLTEDDYNKMFDEQDGKCYLCDEPIALVVDHCHQTNVVRKLLCNQCNLGLGCFKDNLVTLERAIAYLAQFNAG
jgi:hypothetical protein